MEVATRATSIDPSRQRLAEKLGQCPEEPWDQGGWPGCLAWEFCWAMKFNPSWPGLDGHNVLPGTEG